MFIGDQMAVIPSFSGDGIAIALHSSFLATRVHSDGADVKSHHQQAHKFLKGQCATYSFLLATFTSPRQDAGISVGPAMAGLMANIICRIHLKPALNH